MTLFEEIKRLKKALEENVKIIEKKNKRIEELTIQLSDAQFESRTKDYIIATKEVQIDDLQRRLRDTPFMG